MIPVIRVAVASYLLPPLFDRLRAALPQTVNASSIEELRARVEHEASMLVIADPCRDSGRCAELLAAIHVGFPSCTVAVYTTLTHGLARHLLTLGAAGISDVVLSGYDDSPAHFEDLAYRVAGNPLAATMLEELRAELSALPEALQQAVRMLYAHPLRFRATDDLVAVAHMSRRTMYEHFKSAGVGSLRLLVASGRVLRAISLLQDPGRTLREISERLAFGRPDHLGAQIRSLCGLRVADIRSGVDHLAVASTIAGRIRHRESTPANELVPIRTS